MNNCPIIVGTCVKQSQRYSEGGVPGALLNSYDLITVLFYPTPRQVTFKEPMTRHSWTYTPTVRPNRIFGALMCVSTDRISP